MERRKPESLLKLKPVLVSVIEGGNVAVPEGTQASLEHYTVMATVKAKMHFNFKSKGANRNDNLSSWLTD